MLRLATNSRYAFVSVQRNTPWPDVMNCPQVELAGSLVENFADAAALIAHMDLIISADCVTAHLAGSLGKSTWILLPFQ